MAAFSYGWQRVWGFSDNLWVFQWEPASCVCSDLQSSCRMEGTEWKERAVSLFSPLFNLHVHMPDVPDSTRPRNNFPAGQRHADCTIFSHPEFRRRPMQPSTVICHPSVPPSHFYIFPPTSRSVSVKFPLSPSISVLARTPASHCAPSLSCPSLCLCLFASPSFFWLNLFFARLSSFFSLLSLSYIFRQAWFSSGPTFRTSSHFLNNMPIKSEPA